MSASPHNSGRRTAAALLLVVAGVSLSTAGPSSAAGAKNIVYGADWTFSGQVRATLHARASSVTLADYVSTDYYDRATATPGRSERVTIGTYACPSGSFFNAGMSLFAEPANWANKVVGSSASPGRVQIGCVDTNGVTHHYRWGASITNGVETASNCVQVTRPAATTYSLDASNCPALDETFDSGGNRISATNTSLPFTATVSLTGTTTGPPPA